jgi:hypothetical protein
VLIVYRACSVGGLKERPIEDKRELVKTCFTSFLKAFGGVDYSLKILLDKPNTEFRELFKGHDVEESFYADFSEGNTRSFHRQIDIALEKGKDFLFVEDDYFWLDGKPVELALKEVDGFITPYDHPGYYSEDIHSYDKKVRVMGNHHWQRVISTTLTFGGKYEHLKQEAETMKKYGWADHPMWLNVTKRLPLYSPIPTLATHMETPHLSPCVDWPFLQTS